MDDLTALPLFEALNLTHRAEQQLVCDGLSFTLQRGEIVGLLTDSNVTVQWLLAFLSGQELPNEGVLLWCGKIIRPTRIAAPRRLGIVTLRQKAELCPQLTVTENILLAQHAPLSPEHRQLLSELTKQLELTPQLNSKAEALPYQMWRRLEVAQALMAQPALLIIEDDPSASIIHDELICSLLSKYAILGGAILLVSSQTSTVRELCTRALVLREARIVLDADPRKVADTGFHRYLYGQDLPQMQAELPAFGPLMLRLNQLAFLTAKGTRYNFSLEVHQGECIGVWHPVPQVLWAMAQRLRRLHAQPPIDGKVWFQPSQSRTTLALRFLPPIDSGSACNAAQNIAQNWSLESVLGAPQPMQLEALVQQHEIEIYDATQALQDFSAGIQQRLLLMRAAEAKPSPQILVLLQPTQGIDTISAYQLYQQVNQLRARGITVLWLSSKWDEICRVSSRRFYFEQFNLIAERDPYAELH